ESPGLVETYHGSERFMHECPYVNSRFRCRAAEVPTGSAIESHWNCYHRILDDIRRLCALCFALDVGKDFGSNLIRGTAVSDNLPKFLLETLYVSESGERLDDMRSRVLEVKANLLCLPFEYAKNLAA